MTDLRTAVGLLISALFFSSLAAGSALGQEGSITFVPRNPHDGEIIDVTVEIPRTQVCDLDPVTTLFVNRVDIQLQEECLAPGPLAPQEDPAILRLEIGILPASTYRFRVLGGSEELLADASLKVGREGNCIANLSTLCLQRGRFQVRALYRATERVGPGHTLHKSDETGYFTFFGEDNIEVVVKILDGCNTSFNTFWVFTAGLTNVGVQLQVKDTVTGQEREYYSDERTPYPTILDTRALAVCP